MGRGVFHRGRFPPPLSLLKCTGSGRSAPNSALRPARQSVSHLYWLRSPTEVQKVCLGFSSSPFSDSVLLSFLSATFACVRARRELRVKRTKRCREEGVSKFSLAKKVAGVHRSRQGGRVEELFSAVLRRRSSALERNFEARLRRCSVCF